MTMGSPVPPLSINSTGVRPGSVTISTLSAASWSCAHSASSSAAAATAPRPSQSGSKAGERHGMRVYSLRAGRMRSSQAASMSITGASRPGVLGDLGQPVERLGHGRRRLLTDLVVLQEERLLVPGEVPRLGHLGPAVDRLEL